MTCNNVIMYVSLETIPRCSVCSKAGWKPQLPRVPSGGWWLACRSPTRTIQLLLPVFKLSHRQQIVINVLSSLSTWTFSQVRYVHTKINEALRVLCVRTFNGFVCYSIWKCISPNRFYSLDSCGLVTYHRSDEDEVQHSWSWKRKSQQSCTNHIFDKNGVMLKYKISHVVTNPKRIISSSM